MEKKAACAVSEKPHYTIVLTGVVGAGKSTAGNFFLKKNEFVSEGGLLSVTEKCSYGISEVNNKTIKIIDSPGFFDDFDTTKETLKELSRCFTLARDGIHAMVFVINNRYNPLHELAINQLLKFKGIKPFVIILLTHAKNNGINQVETEKYIKMVLSSPKCPKGLKDLIGFAENRVICVESVSHITENYQKEKREELLTMVKEIARKKGVYKCVLSEHAAKVYQDAEEKLKALSSKQFEKFSMQQLQDAQQPQTQPPPTDSSWSSSGSSLSLKSRKVSAVKQSTWITSIPSSKATDIKTVAENLTQDILTKEMVSVSKKDQTFAQFVGLYSSHASNPAATVAATTAVGTTIGAVIGSFIPVGGTISGGIVGGAIGAAAGATYGALLITVDKCKTS